MEVTIRFKALDLIDRVPEELWTKVQNVVEESVTILKKTRNTRKQSGCLKRLYK